MTTQMVRKQMYITKRQNTLLKRLSKARGMSEAEIIRQAIDREISGGAIHTPAPAQSDIDQFIELALQRRSMIIHGEPYHWNREEIYEERENRWIHSEKPE